MNDDIMNHETPRDLPFTHFSTELKCIDLNAEWISDELLCDYLVDLIKVYLS